MLHYFFDLHERLSSLLEQTVMLTLSQTVQIGPFKLHKAYAIMLSSCHFELRGAGNVKLQVPLLAISL